MSLAVLHCRNTNKTQIGKQPSAAIRRFFIILCFSKRESKKAAVNDSLNGCQSRDDQRASSKATDSPTGHQKKKSVGMQISALFFFIFPIQISKKQFCLSPSLPGRIVVSRAIILLLKLLALRGIAASKQPFRLF